MSTRIQLRRGTAAQWTAANPILADGEFGFEKDTGAFKFGDGVTAWTALPYRSGSASTQLVAWALQGAFRVVSSSRNTDGILTSANVEWPDGTQGVFTTTTINASGAIDAWQVTYLGATTKTVTQPAVTRDATGAVSVQPALVIS